VPLRLGLHILYFRIETLDGIGNAADQAASAYRYHDSVYFWKLIHKFQSYRALSGYDIFIIKRMNKGVALLVAQAG
jgi:hypothetical protein